MIGGVLLCVGDSLTHGSRDEFGLSYPRLLGRMLSEKYSQCWVGVEKGINGEESSETLRRFYDVVKSYPEAAEVVLWIGVNDAKKPGLSPEMYEANLREMVAICKFFGKPIVVATLPKQIGFGAPDFIDNELIEKYNERIMALNEEVFKNKYHTMWYVNLHEVPDAMRSNGVHLTHKGNVWVAERVMAIIERERS